MELLFWDVQEIALGVGLFKYAWKCGGFDEVYVVNEE